MRCASGPRANIRPFPGRRYSAPSTDCCMSSSLSSPNRRASIAIARAESWTTERLNGVDGLGAIFPAMVNSLLMYDVLGVPASDPRVKAARESIERLLVVHEHEAYCQPCVSPVWDTALVAHALLEAGGDEARARVKKALEWLAPLQILDVKGDWAAQRPDVAPGGWAFQYANAYYPDVDDTAVVVTAMDRLARETGEAPYGERDRARAGMDRGAAEQEWRLGRLRRRQLPLPPQPHSLRRSRRAARSADRRRFRALRLDAGAAWRHARVERAAGARSRLSARRTDGRRELVRALGRELHLRRLVVALRAERRRPAAGA